MPGAMEPGGGVGAAPPPGPTTPASAPAPPLRVLAEPIGKPASDERQYRHVTLPNRLPCVLVHDAEADKGAACMTVRAGSLADPDSLPGLAHFLEHMLFLGTEKFPDESAYHDFLAANGGAHNAYTALEDTVYFFDVVHTSLRGALDRFAQFFVAPLFTEAATSRELHAVDSEHSNNLQSDTWRLFQLQRALSTPGHPAAQFATGSLATLRDRPAAAGVDVRAALVQFYAAHYSANRMSLAVYGRESLDELQGWVAELFAGVPDRDLGVPRGLVAASATPPYAPRAHGGARGTLCRVVPVMSLRLLSVAWLMPPARPHWRAKPLAYLGHVLGHESEGSLLHLLKARGWAESLSAGERLGLDGWAMFAVSVELTEEGDGRIGDVLDALFEYVAVVRAVRGGAHERAEDELVGLAQLAFAFEERGEPLARAQSLSLALCHYPPAEVLTGPALHTARAAGTGVLGPFLDALAPHEAMATHVSRRYADEAAAAVGEGVGDGEVKAAEGGAATGAGGAAGAGAGAAGGAAGADGADGAAGAGGAAGGGSATSGSAPPPADGAWRRERWYGTPFRLSPLEPDAISRWADVDARAADGAGRSPPLAMPEPNPFVPTDFSVRALAPAAADEPPPPAPPPPPELAPAAAEALAAVLGGRSLPGPPTELSPTPPLPAGIQLWHKLDRTFLKPRLAVYVQLRMAAAYASPSATVLCNLYTRLLSDALQCFAYHAEVADLHYTLYNTARGLTLKLAGFSHKLPLLLQRIVGKMAAMRGEAIQPERFEIYREQQALDYANFWKGAPYGAADYHAAHALDSGKWHLRQYAAFLADTGACTAHALREFVGARLFADGVAIDMLVHGNATADEAAALARVVGGALLAPGDAGGAPLDDARAPMSRCVWLPRAAPSAGRAGVRHVSAAANELEGNAAIDLTLQIGRSTPRRDALLALAAAICEPRAYAQLRTTEQLGYIVATLERSVAGVRCLRLVVQSKVQPPQELEARTETFLAGFGAVLRALPAEEFRRFATSLIESRLQRDKAMADETTRDWAEIFSGTLDFARARKEAEALATISQPEIAAFWERYIAPGGARRRKMIVCVHAGSRAAAGGAEPAEAAPAAAAAAPAAAAPPPSVSVPPPLVELRTVDEVFAFRRARPLCAAQTACGSAMAAAAAAESSGDEE